MVALNEKYKDRVNTIGINLKNKDAIEDVRNYVVRYNITYPVPLDIKGVYHKQFGETGFPALFFINTRGGVINYIEEACIELIDQN